MRASRLHAEPHRNELVVNNAIEAVIYLFLPNNLLSHPDMGMMMAFETR